MIDVAALIRRGERFRGLWITLSVVAGVNFFAFAFIASRIGGDALNGEMLHGRYYVRNHAQLTEVSRQVFAYSKWHAMSLMVTHPLGIAATFLLNRGRIWRWQRR